jgi:hypothetical protein
MTPTDDERCVVRVDSSRYCRAKAYIGESLADQGVTRREN